MTEQEIYTKLLTLNIPIAYDHFADEKPNTPFVTYRALQPAIFNADNKNYFKQNNFEIELVTSKKDLELENQVESLIADIPYTKDNDLWDDEERAFHIIYSI